MQKDVIRKMVQEKHGYAEIEKELQKQFGEQAYKRTTIYQIIQETKLGFPQAQESSNNENHIDRQLLITIQREIAENPFFSVCSLAQKLKVPPSTLYRYLTNELHLVYKHTRWVPHLLNSDQKNSRKQISFELFQVLEKSKHNSYRDIITGDQSQFLYNYAPEGQWVLEDDEAPVFSNSRICIEKMMITVIWGVFGTYR